MKLNTLKPADGARQERTPRRSRYRFRPGQDLRPRPQGFVRAFGQGQDQGRLRRRPDAAMQRVCRRSVSARRMRKDTAEVLLYQLDKLPGRRHRPRRAARRQAGAAHRQARQDRGQRGEVTKAFVLKGVAATAGAKAAIEAAGGSVAE